jgi:NTE family protein
VAQDRPRIGLVLSGGGARGAFQVGVYEGLSQDARFRGPMVLSGTSAGAINAAFIAAGKSPDEMMRFWEGLADRLPVEATEHLLNGVALALAGLTVTESLDWPRTFGAWRFFLTRMVERFPPWPGRLVGLGIEYFLTERFDLLTKILEAVPTPCLVDTRRLRERLVAALGDPVRCQEHDLAISAVDAETGKVVRFVSRATPLTESSEYVAPPTGITVDMVLASASIPVIFPPTPVGERLFWDGGFMVNTPMAPVVALGAEEIVTVLVTELDAKPTFDRLGAALERAVDSFLENSYDSDRKLLLERNRLAQTGVRDYQQVKLYKPIRPGEGSKLVLGSYLYFNKPAMLALRAAGRAAAGRWLADPDPEDRL